MEMFFRKTTELADEDIRQIGALFQRVFQKELTKETFLGKFRQNDLGFSFHSFFREGGRIVASHSFIPVRYTCFGKDILLGLNVDTMIDLPYRNFDVLYDLVRNIEQEVAKYGIACIIGFPNENSYPVFTKGFRYQEIGRLNIRIIPVRPDALLKRRLVPRWIFIPLIKGIIAADGFFSHFAPQREIVHPISRSRDDAFAANRFRWMNKEYHLYKGNTPESAVYSVEEMNGLTVAFIITSFSDTRKIFRQTARAILDNEQNIDMIMYVGTARQLPWYFMNVPERHRPKEFYFTGKELKGNMVDPRFFEMDHWQIDLSDYDLI